MILGYRLFSLKKLRDLWETNQGVSLKEYPQNLCGLYFYVCDWLKGRKLRLENYYLRLQLFVLRAKFAILAFKSCVRRERAKRIFNELCPGDVHGMDYLFPPNGKAEPRARWARWLSRLVGRFF